MKVPGNSDFAISIFFIPYRKISDECMKDMKMGWETISLTKGYIWYFPLWQKKINVYNKKNHGADERIRKSLKQGSWSSFAYLS